MRRLPLAVLPLLLLPACGGEPDARAAYVAQAEEVCAEANEARAALERPASVAALPGYVQQLVLVASDASAELAALEPPAEDAAELQEKFLGPLQEQVKAGQEFARRVQQAAASNDTAGLLRLLGQAPTTTRADLEFLRDYGFSACVEAADTGSAAGGGA